MRSKYGNQKQTVDGIKFDSIKEANYYCYLKMQGMLGNVTHVDLQVPFELQPKYKRNGKTVRAIYYIADFVVHYPDGHKEVIDVKGVRTEVYRLKKKLLLYKYPDLIFKEE